MFKRSQIVPKQPFEGQPGNHQHYLPASSLLTWLAASSFAALLGFARLSYGLLLPALRADLGGSYSIYGVLSTINFVGYLLGTLTTPVLLVRVQNRSALNTSAMLATSVTLLASALSLNVWQLGTWRFLIGFFSATATVLTMTLTLECILPSERGKASGLVWLGGALGILLSGLIAPPIIGAGTSSGWRVVWVVMALLSAASAIGFHISRRRADPPLAKLPNQTERTATRSQQHIWLTLRPMFQPRRLLFLVLSYFCFGGGYIIYFTFFISLLAQQGVPAQNAGFVWAAIGFTGAISGWLWGNFIDRWPTGYMLTAPLALGALGSLTVLTGNLLWEAIGAALIGLTAFIAPPLIVTALLKRAVSDAEYATNFSALTALFAIGQILGPLVAGQVIERSGLAAGTAISALVLAFGAIFAYLYAVVQRQLQAAKL
ncbi:MAG: YbfB/YjiJ family MFS transporter [Ktedonobacteraceae bacterium]|nr:YbfB/YjiJ family MFS transporter [Ktedonobacteraceae bacterium]